MTDTATEPTVDETPEALEAPESPEPEAVETLEGVEPEGAEEAPFDPDEALDTLESSDEPEAKALGSKLRGEIKALRERTKTYEDTFDGLHENDAQALLALVQQVKADPAAAAETMRTFAQVRAGEDPEPTETPEGETEGEEDDPPLTRKQYEELRAKEAEEARVAEQAKVMRTKAAELVGDDEGLQNQLLMTSRETNFDLDEAFKLMRERATKLATVKREEGKPAPSGGPPKPQSKLDDVPLEKRAQVAMEARLERQYGKDSWPPGV